MTEPADANDMEDRQPPPPSIQLMNMALGTWWARAIYVAADLRVADYLAQGPQDISTLTAMTGTHGPSLYRLLRFLTGLGIFTEIGPGTFTQSTLSTALRSDVPGSVRDDVLMQGADWHWQAWGVLGHTVRTGQPAIDHLFGEDLFSYFAHQNPEGGRLFHRMLSLESYAPLLEAYDFAGLRRVVDVGGGQGGLLNALVKTYPALQAVLFERPEVVEEVRNRRAELGLDERIELVGGDFFSAIPAADVYILRNIIHDWSDDEAAIILRTCRSAVNPDGRVLVIEQVVPEWDEWASIKFGDLDMMVLTHGRERVAAEFRSLFTAGGFQLTRIIPTSSELCILEGTAPNSAE